MVEDMERLTSNQCNIFKAVKENIKEAQLKQKQQYNKKHACNSIVFQSNKTHNYYIIFNLIGQCKSLKERLYTKEKKRRKA